MKYSKLIGLISAVLLIVVCFLPWTYHADIDKTFTGFFSERGMYGRPGKFFIFFAVICIAMLLVPRIWAKRVHLFVAALMVAYAIKTYVLFTSCYNAYCPEKKMGIYLVLILSIVQFVSSLFADISLPVQKRIDQDAVK